MEETKKPAGGPSSGDSVLELPELGALCTYKTHPRATCCVTVVGDEPGVAGLLGLAAALRGLGMRLMSEAARLEGPPWDPAEPQGRSGAEGA